jgi:hypothetical protein
MSATLKDLEKIINSGLTTSIIKSEIKFDQLYIEIEPKNNIVDIIFFGSVSI